MFCHPNGALRCLLHGELRPSKGKGRRKIFNILNHANFGVPASAAIFDAAGNNVSSTQTPSRQMQFALKLFFRSALPPLIIFTQVTKVWREEAS